MIVAHPPADQARVLREAATRTMARLGLAGFDNASIAEADAWIDSQEFREQWSNGRIAPAFDVAAYLGEAIIRRHGGTWSFDATTPCVTIARNGQHVISPFTKVQKRALNGREDHLLGLVHLAEHLVKTPALDAYAVSVDALTALALGEDQSGRMTGLRALGILFLAIIGFPLAVLVVLLLTIDPSYALIGGACAVPVGFVALAVISRLGAKRAPSFRPGTLAFEAQLTLAPLEMRLREKLHALDPQHPSQDALAEVAFYTAQLHDLHAIVARRDPSPGRGFIGFDSYATGRVSSWIRTRSS
jgi:hypothetical protein